MSITDPNDIAKCIGWYDPNLSTITLDSGGPRIASITDLSGNGNTFDNSPGGSGSGPTIESAYLNGKDVLRAGGFVGRSSMMPGLTAGEGIIYCKNVADDASDGLWGFGSGGRVLFPDSFDGKIADNFGSDSEHSTGYNPPFTLTDWNIWSVAAGSGTWTARFNNTSIYTTATNTVGWRTQSLIGRGPGGNNYNGYIAAWYLFNDILTTQERADMHEYITDVAFAVAATVTGPRGRVSGFVG